METQSVIVDGNGDVLSLVNGKYLPVAEQGGSVLNPNQVAMTATVAEIIPANAARYALILKNIGANPVFIGPSGVTATTGHELASGETLTLTTTAAVYGICGASLTSTMSYLEQS